jgi:hypothetical protein
LHAQQADDLRRQLEVLKTEYQQRIQDREKRLAALEQAEQPLRAFDASH